jgi:8-oxo-dGTP pyrophosphatase MutT (NUDIX family)
VRHPELTRLLDGIEPWDEVERAHLDRARAWVGSGAPLYRTRKPDVPPMHLVSYFVVRDAVRDPRQLVAPPQAGLWEPAGGHVEPDEDPWETVVRECREELHIDAVPLPATGTRPFFLTLTGTRGQGRHTDVSLWYVLSADAESVTSFDAREFETIRWQSPREVLAEPLSTLDPHLHRFTRKLLAAGTQG